MVNSEKGGRNDDRHITVYRFAKVERKGDAGLWRIGNISNRGIMFEVGVSPCPNEVLTITLSDGLVLRGRVVWSGDGKCGVAFEEAVNACEILRQIVEDQEANRYRPLRVPVSFPAQLLTKDGPVTISVTTLSRSGVSFTCLRDFTPDTEIFLALIDGVWREGRICWSRKGQGGLSLKLPFTVPDLESMEQFQRRV
ncbi:MAG: PilZ domain-containing protein [Sphingopyxis sp.]|nr:PilZ domain-containing protein [Sphingopyxis sp.]